jgi:hypothetical protein
LLDSELEATCFSRGDCFRWPSQRTILQVVTDPLYSQKANQRKPKCSEKVAWVDDSWAEAKENLRQIIGFLQSEARQLITTLYNQVLE